MLSPILAKPGSTSDPASTFRHSSAISEVTNASSIAMHRTGDTPRRPEFRAKSDYRKGAQRSIVFSTTLSKTAAAGPPV
jgi:hypothetical protein